MSEKRFRPSPCSVYYTVNLKPSLTREVLVWAEATMTTKELGQIATMTKDMALRKGAAGTKTEHNKGD